MGSMPTDTPEYDVILVGAGFASFSIINKYVSLFLSLLILTPLDSVLKEWPARFMKRVQGVEELGGGMLTRDVGLIVSLPHTSSLTKTDLL
jgi:hypothetical protein